MREIPVFSRSPDEVRVIDLGNEVEVQFEADGCCDVFWRGHILGEVASSIPKEALLAIVADRLKDAIDMESVETHHLVKRAILILDGTQAKQIAEKVAFIQSLQRPCDTCGRSMPAEEDCGGDCVDCMAAAGDPECVEYVRQRDATRSPDTKQEAGR